MSTSVGNWLQLRGSLGDHYNGRSVVVPKGTKGQIIDIEARGSERYIVVKMLGSEGQPILTTRLPEVWAIWEPCQGVLVQETQLTWDW